MNLIISLLVYGICAVTSFELVVVREAQDPDFRSLFLNYQSVINSTQTRQNQYFATLGSPKPVYLIKHNEAMVIPDWKTVRLLIDTSNDTKIQEVNSRVLSRLTVIPWESRFSVVHEETDNQRFQRFFFLSRFVQEITLEIVNDLGEACNPSIIPFQDRLLMVSRLPYYTQKTPSILYFKWYNDSSNYNTSTSEETAAKYLGVRTGQLAPLNDTYTFYGQDARLLKVTEDEFYVFFTSAPPRNPKIHVGMAVMKLNKLSKTLEVILRHEAVTLENQVQKNLGPFFLPEESEMKARNVYLVDTINPLCVIRVNHVEIYNSSKNRISYDKVSCSSKVEFKWELGLLRGGTPPIYISKYDVFLGFFHTSTWFTSVNSTSKASMRRYFFGAYTFTSSPPFRLISFTQFPLWNHRLYSGSRAPFTSHIDFITFPTTAWVEEKDWVMVIIGHQDIRAYQAKINLHQLLQNMVKVSP